MGEWSTLASFFFLFVYTFIPMFVVVLRLLFNTVKGHYEGQGHSSLCQCDILVTLAASGGFTYDFSPFTLKVYGQNNVL